MQKIFNSVIFITTLSLSFGLFSDEEDDARDRGGIEEITVTAEKEHQLFLIPRCQ